MPDRILYLVEEVIKRANRLHPADTVLRDELRAAGLLGGREASEAAELLFDYYRWLGWTDASAPISKQLERARRMAERFAANPNSISETELRARALPDWAGRQMEAKLPFLRAIQTAPSVWLRARPGTGGQLSDSLGHCERAGAGFLEDALRYWGGKDLFRTPEFHEGRFELQDLNSQAVGWLCAPGARQTWWDACAGEGGKTLHLSDLMGNSGLIWASDRSAWRLAQLKRRAARAKVFNYRTAIWDGGERLPTRTQFDGVLVDAPCSGVGTWARKPHARWTTTLDDVEELGAVQERLLGNAVPALKPGGRLVYAVCTLTRRETTQVVRAIGAKFPQLEPMAVANPLAPDGPAAAQHWMMPQDRGANGMFAALWRKR